MPVVIYEDPAGVVHEVDADVSETVMSAAVRNGVPGIVAECGGALSCASCHVYVDPSWLDRVGRAAEAEDDCEDEMLEATAAERLDCSRLSCQIRVTPELGGVKVRIPAEQL